MDQLCWHATLPDLLSTASGDKTVRIWDVRAGKCSTTINTKGENINITWSPDGNTIAVGNKEDLVTFIDTRTHKIRAEEQFNFEVNEIAWNNTSNLFFLTNGQGCIHVLSYPDLELQHMLKAHPGTCICIEFDPTGRYFATGSADALVSLWDANELACLVSLTLILSTHNIKFIITMNKFFNRFFLSGFSAFFHVWIGQCVPYHSVMTVDCWHQRVKIFSSTLATRKLVKRWPIFQSMQPHSQLPGIQSNTYSHTLAMIKTTTIADETLAIYAFGDFPTEY